MTDHSGKIMPHPTPETRPYWDACRKGELVVQRCKDCGAHQFYPRMMCTSCDSDSVEWTRASGRGRVSSYTVVRRPVSKAYAAETPYIVALIQLEEGPTLMSNIVGCDPGAVAVGMSVEVLFEQWTDEVTVPKFRATQPAE
jgi:uncharacterized OB-fold protein